MNKFFLVIMFALVGCGGILPDPAGQTVECNTPEECALACSSAKRAFNAASNSSLHADQVMQARIVYTCHKQGELQAQMDHQATEAYAASRLQYGYELAQRDAQHAKEQEQQRHDKAIAYERKRLVKEYERIDFHVFQCFMSNRAGPSYNGRPLKGSVKIVLNTYTYTYNYDCEIVESFFKDYPDNPHQAEAEEALKEYRYRKAAAKAAEAKAAEAKAANLAVCVNKCPQDNLANCKQGCKLWD